MQVRAYTLDADPLGKVLKAPNGKTALETLRNFPNNMKEIKPTIMLSAPALAKNLQKGIERGIKEKGGIGAVFADFDGDGKTDLYVVRGAYPYGINVLYRQGRDGTFIDISEDSGAAGRKNGISAVAGDFAGKGNLDIFVSNWGTNTLYKNSGSGMPLFSDASHAAGISEEGKSWGALISDFNCDGRPDIFVMRGGFGKPEDIAANG